MYETIYIKEYDSLHIIGEYTDDFGAAISLQGIMVSSDIKTLGGLVIDNLSSVVATPSNGQFILTGTKNQYPAGSYLLDILFENTLSGMTVASETFKLVVSNSITIPRGAY